MPLSWRTARWAVFIVLTVVSYAVLAGMSQALVMLVLKFRNQELNRGHFAIAGLFSFSLLAFALAGWLLSKVMPLDGAETRYALLTVGLICTLVPVGTVPYDLIPVATVRMMLAVLTCTLMLAGARQPILLRSSAPE